MGAETRNACWKFATCKLDKEWNYNFVRSLGNCEDGKWMDQTQDCILWPAFFLSSIEPLISTTKQLLSKWLTKHLFLVFLSMNPMHINSQ
jgi:hypothetical protein